MEKAIEDLKDTFRQTLGHGNFTFECWTATTGIYISSCARLLPLWLASGLHAAQLLMVLNFLKEYRVAAAACVVFGYKSSSSYEAHVWEGLTCLDRILPEVRLSITGDYSDSISSILVYVSITQGPVALPKMLY